MSVFRCCGWCELLHERLESFVGSVVVVRGLVLLDLDVVVVVLSVQVLWMVEVDFVVGRFQLVWPIPVLECPFVGVVYLHQ